MVPAGCVTRAVESTATPAGISAETSQEGDGQ